MLFLCHKPPCISTNPSSSPPTPPPSGLTSPILQADWNPKIVSIDRNLTGPVTFGERFEMIYRISNRDRQSNVEITDLQPPQRITFLHRIPWKSTLQIVQESYEISPAGDRVKVLQTIDLSQAGIPWPVRLLIRFLHRFGQKSEKPYLHKLKHLIEHPQQP